MHWYQILSQVVITWFTWKCCNYLSNRSPINVINGVTLPKVDDIRWEINIDPSDEINGKLGSVTFKRNCKSRTAAIFINEIWIECNYIQSYKYTLAICKNYQQRKSLESINQTKFPELTEEQ